MLFYAGTTAHRDRKEIIRSMVERVVVSAKTTETISARITWADGSEVTAIEVPLMRYAHRWIAEMAGEGLANAEIAERLNNLGLKTSRGKSWSTATVWQARQYGAGRARFDHHFDLHDDHATTSSCFELRHARSAGRKSNRPHRGGTGWRACAKLAQAIGLAGGHRSVRADACVETRFMTVVIISLPATTFRLLASFAFRGPRA